MRHSREGALRSSRRAVGQAPGTAGPPGTRRIGLWLAAALLAAPLSWAQGSGRITGLVTLEDGSPVGGVEVSLGEPRWAVTTSDVNGRFALESVPAGTHELSFSLAGDRAVETVDVVAGETAVVEKVVNWVFYIAETLSVYTASRRQERVVDAPAAMTTITQEQIEREASTGQLPKLFESAAGVEVTQSGLYDFKLNVRGINSTINRRVAVLVDGRNPSVPFLGTQEWSAIPFPLDDLESAELARGPSSALYGANAFNGVLNLITKSPRYHRGGRVRLAVGDLDTIRADLRVATELGGGWYFKAMGGYHESLDFFTSRNETLEYSVPCTAEVTIDCLFIDAAPLPFEEVEIEYASLRFDKELDRGRVLVLEGGQLDQDGIGLTSPAGRWLFTDGQRPWARINFNAPRWNLLGYYTGRDADAFSLTAGVFGYLESFRSGLEFQTNWDFADGRGRAIAGAFVGQDETDSVDPSGVQSLLVEAVTADLTAAFGQVEYSLGDRLKLVAAARWDDNSIVGDQFSPKASLVYALSANQTARLSYNQAFQTPNFAELFIESPVAPPLDLSPFEAGFCAPAGVSCGFGTPVAIVVAGNEDLDYEKVTSLDLGYSGILGGKAFLTVDYYWNTSKDFTLLLVPQLGTVLGRANPNFGPYAPPAALPAADAAALVDGLQGALGDFYAVLSNNKAGDPLFVPLSIVNFGEVETQGIELALDYYLSDGWNLEFNYGWFDFRVVEELAEKPSEPNGPEHKLNLGLTHSRGRFSGSLRYRWVDSFRFSEGILVGNVPSYDVVNLIARYELSDSWDVGLNVSNLLDNKHYEIFSGDVMERRALAHVSYSW